MNMMEAPAKIFLYSRFRKCFSSFSQLSVFSPYLKVLLLRRQKKYKKWQPEFWLFFLFLFILVVRRRRDTSTGSIPLESRQWLFPFKAATFSTVVVLLLLLRLLGREKVKIQKDALHKTSVCASDFLFYTSVSGCCLRSSTTISQPPNACTLAFTFPPPGSMCVYTREIQIASKMSTLGLERT